ncbi:hypothetical protein HBH98_182200 [Parastagonospora nodorum]|nr:hypothetical protein HBH53_231570 [Parastagonospora nodorum]KAH3956674.1 hypothetical protein HBH51_237940 [Parastagonospora nodorum]KAH4215674.1 hypothetical protein HBI06_244710 [Parastagonospora nodorum]KAH4224481.1 hypothetical protein HBI05_236980 [Parastagonospora nodorum]KAH4341241.1 hypothetical protein HBH98_182200 [Parastagonospora nodorum]
MEQNTASSPTSGHGNVDMSDAPVETRRKRPGRASKPAASSIALLRPISKERADKFEEDVDANDGDPTPVSIRNVLHCRDNVVEDAIRQAVSFLTINYRNTTFDEPDMSAACSAILTQLHTEVYQNILHGALSGYKEDNVVVSIITRWLWDEAKARKRALATHSSQRGGKRKRHGKGGREGAVESELFGSDPDDEGSTPNKRAKTTNTCDITIDTSTDFVSMRPEVWVFDYKWPLADRPVHKFGLMDTIDSALDVLILTDRPGKSGVITQESFSFEEFRKEIQNLAGTDKSYAIWSALEHTPVNIATKSILSDGACLLREQGRNVWPTIYIPGDNGQSSEDTMKAYQLIRYQAGYRDRWCSQDT